MKKILAVVFVLMLISGALAALQIMDESQTVKDMFASGGTMNSFVLDMDHLKIMSEKLGAEAVSGLSAGRKCVVRNAIRNIGGYLSLANAAVEAT